MSLTFAEWRVACQADAEGIGVCPYKTWEPASATVDVNSEGAIEFACEHGCKQATVEEYLETIPEFTESFNNNGAAPRDDSPGPRRRLEPRVADPDRFQPFRWAWRNRVLIGYLNLLVGDEGTGKGVLIAWLLARLTRGELPGELHGHPANVLVVGDEDGFDGVWTPRIMAAGGDFSRVWDLPIGDDGALDIRRDAGEFREMIREYNIEVVVFDQLLDNLGVGVDDWKAKQVRDAVAPLRRLTGELGIAVIAGLHTNKSQTGSFRQRVAGTAAFNQLSRSSLLLARHPDDEKRRVLVRPKGNYAPDPGSFEFSIHVQPLTLNGHCREHPFIADLAEGNLTAGDVLGEPRKDLTKADQGRRIIEGELQDGGWHTTADVLSVLAEAGIGDREARRLATDLGVEHKKASGFPARALWRLANSQGDVERAERLLERHGEEA